MIIYIILAGIAFLLLISIGWTWGSYNNFITGRQNIKTMWSNIKTEYQRRADLLYNLAEAVKSYAKFEKNTLVDVIAMRNGNFGRNAREEMSKMKSLDDFFSRLLVVFERYPKLKANETYKRLMREVRITEDRVNIARTEYNDVVRDYNLSVKMFPSNILASMFGFFENEYFESEEGVEKAPKLNLDINSPETTK
jgi:LemA protein